MVTSRIGLGCMGFSQGYGAADDISSIAAIRAGIDAGASMIDTAQSYGAGHNERLLSIALRGRRDEVQVASKFGIVRTPDGVALDARPERVRDRCERSLDRLGIDHLDLYYLHRVDPSVRLEDTIGAMAELVDAGLVRYLGVSEVTAEELRRAHAVAPITAVQVEWSLAWREVEDELVPAARDLGIAIVAYSPLGRGLLTGAMTPKDALTDGDFRSDDPRLSGDDGDANMRVVETLAQIAHDTGLSVGRIALAWLLAQGDDVFAIPGSRSADRVVDNVAAAATVLDQQMLDQIDSVAGRSRWQGDRRSFASPGVTRTR